MNWYLPANLGTLPGFATSVALGINDAGQAVGACSTAGGVTRAFLYSRFQMSDLGSLAGPNGSSYARAVNNSAQVVGWSDVPNGQYYHAFIYNNGRMIDLGTLGGPGSRAHDINSSGQIVGTSYTADMVKHAFLYTNGHMVDLGSLGGDSIAWAINDAGQVVGDSNGHGFLYDHGQMQALGPLRQALDIDNSGRIAGQTSGPALAGGEAGLFDSNGVTNLGALGGLSGVAFALNDAGFAIGAAELDAQGNTGPFVWDRFDGILNLNALGAADAGWRVLEANDINASGQIVGGLAVASGQGPESALLLTPVDLGPTLRQITGLDALLRLAYGIVAGAGVPGGPHRPIPVDPVGAFWRGFSRPQQEIILGATINELSALVRDGGTRRALQGPALDLVVQSARELSALQTSDPRPTPGSFKTVRPARIDDVGDLRSHPR